jgi:hypothetical protein
VRPNLDVEDGFASFALEDGFAASDCVVVVVVVVAAAFPRAFPRGEFTFGANALSRLTCTRSVVVVVVDGTRPRPSPTAPEDSSFARARADDAPDAACSAIARHARRHPPQPRVSRVVVVVVVVVDAHEIRASPCDDASRRITSINYTHHICHVTRADDARE